MGWVKGSDRNFEASQTERYILSKPSFWIADDLTSPDNWMSSSLCALRDGIASGAYVACIKVVLRTQSLQPTSSAIAALQRNVSRE